MFKLIGLIGMLLITVSIAAKPIVVSSPDKQLQITIRIEDKVLYNVSYKGTVLIQDSYMQLVLPIETLGANAKLTKQVIQPVSETIRPVVSLKNAAVANQYNLLTLSFKSDYAIEFRAYNNGFAYRFITSKGKELIVQNEVAHFDIPGADSIVFSKTGGFRTGYEIPYRKLKTATLTQDSVSVLPVLLQTKKSFKILLSDADVFDYPVMFVKGNSSNAVDAVFPKVPATYSPENDRSLRIDKTENYIAKTSGNRSFPWRFMVVSENDKQLVDNNMVLQLSRRDTTQNYSWVKPGQVTWEWWHNAQVYKVDFKSGYNLDTYKYYIDFAAANGIPYIIMDEGWAKSTTNPYEPNPTINLPELIAYGKTKGVKIILWFTWLVVENNFDVFAKLESWGIAGMKIDFMDRSDQWMVNYYERVAKEAAKHHILLDFHGAFKPAGIEKLYPNVLSYEGVVGMEQNIGGWGAATTDNNLYLPFLRNAVGPMDYTPGAMFSAHKKDYRGTWTNTQSIGTRCHQLALYVVFESGLQMLADNPVNYKREQDCTDFITSVPVTWDELKVLDASVGEYVLLARKKGSKWFLGGITNHTERHLSIKVDFLPPGETKTITIFQDGINADIQAMDYKKWSRSIKYGDTLEINMVAEGGWVATIE